MTTETTDIRWIQRLSNYQKALAKLEEAVNAISNNPIMEVYIRDLMQEGLIQRFEFTQELAWKVMKDYAEYQGYTDIKGSRDAMRKALQMNLISDDAWLRTIVDRNVTSHTYDEEEVAEIVDNVMTKYFLIFKEFEKKMSELKNETLTGDHPE